MHKKHGPEAAEEQPYELQIMGCLPNCDASSVRIPTVRKSNQSGQVGECQELAVLDLRANALAELPPELALCTRLAFLHVGGNKITDFGPELCKAFVDMQELYLYRNKITSLPPEVGYVSDESLSVLLCRLVVLCVCAFVFCLVTSVRAQ